MSDFEDWARELSDVLDQAARATEAWAEQTLHGAVEAVDSLADDIEKQLRPTLERWAEDINQAVEPFEDVLDQEVERFSEEFSELITPVVVPLTGALETWLETMTAPIVSHVDPMVNDHITCIGCKHYCGQTHGGNMLVCAMYPYGPEAETCPDWESHWGQPDNNG
ncbi:MAG: hypothetical protein AAF773_25605 [Cyanobacteria bacterium P01_D01_bin.115]